MSKFPRCLSMMLHRTVTQSIRVFHLSRPVLLRRSLQCHSRSSPCFSNIKSCLRPTIHTRLFSSTPFRPEEKSAEPTSKRKPTIRENIYTIPNLLTLSRICACPVLAWSVIDGNYYLATGLLVYAGLTDLADGYLARRFKMSSVLGTILDPAADKILMTTLVVSLTMKNLLPLPLAIVILGRDVLLSLSALYIRYSTLPPPKTFSRYWDFSLPSAEVRPTYISKVNTALQLLLMGTTTVSPIIPMDLGLTLLALQYTVATTTIWSGCSYLFTKSAVRVIQHPPKDEPPCSKP